MAVSKGVAADRIREALAAGQRLFGENYVQETRRKWPGLRAEFGFSRGQEGASGVVADDKAAGAEAIELHLIGPLQTNKAKEAVALFDSIDTLDRPKLAAALAKAMDQTGRRVPVMIEVNIGREPQKHGCRPEDLPALLDAVRGLGLEVRGLMAVPPAGAGPAPYFAEMAELARRHGLPELSLGMSGDFEAAVAAGSTLLRLGTAIFGARPEKKRAP